AGRGPRARGRLAPVRRAHDPRVTVELQSPDELEPALEAEGFFEQDDLAARVYVGYRASDGLRRSFRPAPPEPCELPAVAYVLEPAGAEAAEPKGTYAVGPWRTSWSEAAYADAVDAVRAAISEGDVYQVNLVQHLGAVLPRGSVTGCPKIAALDLTAALEPVGRGASMGALGTIRPNGDLDLALTIRTFAIVEGTIHLWVGGGIVWDSDPAGEVEESWVKARPLLAAIGAPLHERVT